MDQNLATPARWRKAESFADARRNMLVAFLTLTKSGTVSVDTLREDAEAVCGAMRQLIELYHA